MNRFPLGRPIQPFLQFRKMFGSLIFFPRLDQGNDFLLSVAGSLQEDAVRLAATKRCAGLLGGRGGVSHKRKLCRKPRPSVNP